MAQAAAAGFKTVATFLAKPVVQGSLLAAAAGTTIVSELNTAKAIEDANKLEAEREKTAAIDRENERRRQLLMAVASNNVEAAASGTLFTGSPRTITISSLRQKSADTVADRANTAARIESGRFESRQARRRAKINIGKSLLDTGIAIGNIKGTGGSKD